MPQRLLTSEYISRLRLQLKQDAGRIAESADGDCRQAWLDSQRWIQYSGEAGRRLYESYTDEELLQILRTAAAQVGHPPSQKEVFCIFRSFIRRRFTNWPTALRAAGLKAPKKKHRIRKYEQTIIREVSK